MASSAGQLKGCSAACSENSTLTTPVNRTQMTSIYGGFGEFSSSQAYRRDENVKKSEAGIETQSNSADYRRGHCLGESG